MTKSQPEDAETMDRADVAVAQWRREMPELSEKLEAMRLLGRLSEASPLMINGWLEPEYARMGLKYGEFDVLATLVRSGPPYKLTPTELYRSTMVSSGGMTARLDRLQKAGHIERCPHPEDRRALLVCLTESGLKMIRDFMPGYVDMQAKALSGLSETERDQLAALLKKLILTADPPTD